MGLRGAFPGWHRLEQLSFEGTLQTPGCCRPRVPRRRALRFREPVIQIGHRQPKKENTLGAKPPPLPSDEEKLKQEITHTHARLKNCADL